MIRKIVIVGGGTSGWISASLIKKVLGDVVDVELVESESIGTIGVGEATIPPIRLLNRVLGIDEKQFLKETNATLKLAINFQNWKTEGHSYFHTFGEAGRKSAFNNFYANFIPKESEKGGLNYWDYDLNYLCCKANRVPEVFDAGYRDEVPYAYHFDSTLYGAFLRKLNESLGVKRTEGLIEEVKTDPANGFVSKLMLENGEEVSGDFFIDCSGQRGLLIKQTLGVKFESWGHWLPCDRAIAVGSERFEEKIPPYTSSIAQSNGWVWRIPLQHRTGNGIVYSSQYQNSDQALDSLLSNLKTKQTGDPLEIKFETGVLKQQWRKNVVAVGLSSGFLEPLESTSIYLVQSAIVRLLHLFPRDSIIPEQVDEFNRQSQAEFELIRDFIVLHYHVNERTDSEFWKYLRNMDVPERLSRKIALFEKTGALFDDQHDLFREASWLQVMVGQGLSAKDYHPLIDSVPRSKFIEEMHKIRTKNINRAQSFHSHDDFLRNAIAD